MSWSGLPATQIDVHDDIEAGLRVTSQVSRCPVVPNFAHGRRCSSPPSLQSP